MTPVGADRYRWVVLGIGALGAGAVAALRMGLPALGPALRDEYALTLPQVGFGFAALSIGVMLTLVPWGVLTDRIGERPVMSVGLLGTAGALVLTAFAPTFGWLLLGLVLAGMFGASATGASGRAVVGWFARRERGLALGIRQMALPLGGAVASATLPALAGAGGLQLALLALAGLTLGSAIAAAIWLRDAPERPLPAGVPLPLHPARDPRTWRLGAASGLLVVAQSALLGFLVIYLVDVQDLSVGLAAAALAVTQVGGAVTRLVAGRRSDRDGFRLPLLRAIARRNAILVGALAVLAGAHTVLVVPLALVAGVSTMSWNGLAFTAAAELSGTARAGTAMSLQNMTVAIGTVVAPVVFGATVAAVSWTAGFALAALAPLVAFAILAPLQSDEADRARERESRLASAIPAAPPAAPIT